MNTTAPKVSPPGKCSMGDLVIVNPTEEYFVSDVIACIVNAALTISTLLLNSIMVIAYSKSSQLRKNISNFLIMVLSCIDVAIGGIVNLTFTVFLLTKITGNGSCMFLFVVLKLIIMLSGMSVATMSSMNLERYIAILHPMTHRAKLTKERLLMFALLFWSGYIDAFIVSFTSQNTQGKMVVSLRLCYIIFTIWTYVKIFLAMRKSRRIFPLNNAESTNNTTSSLETSFNRKKQFLKELKVAKSYILVISSNFICFVPQLIITALYYNGLLVTQLDLFNTWAITVVLLNSSLNSMLFFWLNRKLRYDSIAILKQTCTCVLSQV